MCVKHVGVQFNKGKNMFQTVFEAVSFESACINDETPKIHFCDASIIAKQITNTCNALA